MTDADPALVAKTTPADALADPEARHGSVVLNGPRSCAPEGLVDVDETDDDAEEPEDAATGEPLNASVAWVDVGTGVPSRRAARVVAPTLAIDFAVLADPDTDHEAYQAEWRRVYDCFDPFLRSYLGGVRQYFDANDIVDTIWSKVFRKITQFDPARVDGFAWWLVSIGERAFLDAAKKDQRRLDRETTAVLDSADDTPTHPEHAMLEHLSGDPIIAGNITRRQFEAAMAALPEKSRQVAYLHLVQGVPHEQIAVQLSLPSAMASRKRLEWVKDKVREACRAPGGAGTPDA